MTAAGSPPPHLTVSPPLPLRYVEVMAVDCGVDANSDVCTRHNVTSYPTIKLLGPHYNPTDPPPPKIAERKVDDLKKAVIAQFGMFEKEMPAAAKLVQPQPVAALEQKIVTALKDGSNLLIVAHPENSTLGAEFALHLHQGLGRWLVESKYSHTHAPALPPSPFPSLPSPAQ